MKLTRQTIRNLLKKTVAVVVGYFATLPLFYLIPNQLVLSLTLLVVFPPYYTLMDALLNQIEKRFQKHENT